MCELNELHDSGKAELVEVIKETVANYVKDFGDKK